MVKENKEKPPKKQKKPKKEAKPKAERKAPRRTPVDPDARNVLGYTQGAGPTRPCSLHARSAPLPHCPTAAAAACS